MHTPIRHFTYITSFHLLGNLTVYVIIHILTYEPLKLTYSRSSSHRDGTLFIHSTNIHG